MTTDRRLLLVVVGLSVLGSPAAASDVAAGEWRLWQEEGVIHLRAKAAPRADVVRAIGKAFDLRVVEHAEPDGLVTAAIEEESLHEVMNRVLRDDVSFQLYTSPASGDQALIPSTLWLFPTGSAKPAAAVALLEAVLYEGNRSQKIAAIDSLARMVAPAAIHAIGVALSDDDATVRETALLALEADGSPDALSAIASAGASPAASVRARVAEALSAGGSDAALRYLSLALADNDPRVRLAVVDGIADLPLGTVPTTLALDLLELALNDVDIDVRLQALDALDEMGGGAGYQALREQHERQPLGPEGPWREPAVYDTRLFE